MSPFLMGKKFARFANLAKAPCGFGTVSIEMKRAQLIYPAIPGSILRLLRDIKAGHG
jgi:hypothetical protein